MFNTQKTYLFLLLILINMPLYGHAKSHYTVNGKSFNVADVNKQVEFLMKEVGIPGLSMAVINDGKVVYYKTYGSLNINAEKAEKVRKKTRFEGCSMSKSFVVFAAYKAIQEGLLHLDTPLYKYMENNSLKHDERYKLITARMVLSHCSGIENHIEQNNRGTLEILDEPGNSFIYSGEGYAYLADVIAKVVGLSLEELMEKNVYEPLKLKETYTIATQKANKSHASPHDQFGNPIRRWQNNQPVLMSHIHTNARDYARLLIGIFDSEQINEQSVAQILTPSIKKLDEVFHGPGFELYCGKSDTLISQGGANRGFKGLGVYSITNNSGFVYFANSERSEKIGKELCKVSTGMNISPFFIGLFDNQYPSKANEVFAVYRKNGKEEARKLVDKMIPHAPEVFTVNDMVELVYYFKDKEYNLAKYIASEFFNKCPECDGKVVYDRWLKR